MGERRGGEEAARRACGLADRFLAREATEPTPYTWPATGQGGKGHTAATSRAKNSEAIGPEQRSSDGDSPGRGAAVRQEVQRGLAWKRIGEQRVALVAKGAGLATACERSPIILLCFGRAAEAGRGRGERYRHRRAGTRCNTRRGTVAGAGRRKRSVSRLDDSGRPVGETRGLRARAVAGRPRVAAGAAAGADAGEKGGPRC